MKKSHIGIQPYTFQRTGTVVGKEAVRKGEHSVYPVQRRPAVSAAEKEVLLSIQKQVVKDAEICRSSNAF